MSLTSPGLIFSSVKWGPSLPYRAVRKAGGEAALTTQHPELDGWGACPNRREVVPSLLYQQAQPVSSERLNSSRGTQRRPLWTSQVDQGQGEEALKLGVLSHSERGSHKWKWNREGRRGREDRKALYVDAAFGME